MKKYILFVTGFFVCNFLLYAELTKAQMWAISLTGIMTENNRSNRNSLHASTMDERGRNTWLEVLRRDWEITSREELLETLDSLENGGHAASFREIQEIIGLIAKVKNNNLSEITDILNRYEWDTTIYNRFMYVTDNWDKYYDRSIKAWDLGRSVSLCRWGYNVGFITEDEAWDRIFHIARIIQPLYSSWEEYGYDYFMGRLFWASGFKQAETYFTRTEPLYRRLISGYWSQIDWHTDLDKVEDEVLPVNTIRFLEPDDNDGKSQFITNDPATYNRWYYRYFPNPDPNSNIYECRVRKISGDDDYGYGMIFCVDDSNSDNISYYRFFITVNGRFAIAKRTGNSWTNDPVRWANSPFLNTGYNVYNTLRVERTNNENGAVFRVFINDNLAATFNDNNPINGSKAGPAVSVNVMEMEMFPYIPVHVRYDY